MIINCHEMSPSSLQILLLWKRRKRKKGLLYSFWTQVLQRVRKQVKFWSVATKTKQTSLFSHQTCSIYFGPLRTPVCVTVLLSSFSHQTCSIYCRPLKTPVCVTVLLSSVSHQLQSRCFRPMITSVCVTVVLSSASHQLHSHCFRPLRT